MSKFHICLISHAELGAPRNNPDIKTEDVLKKFLEIFLIRCIIQKLLTVFVLGCHAYPHATVSKCVHLVGFKNLGVRIVPFWVGNLFQPAII
jgi:hypothetical protein